MWLDVWARAIVTPALRRAMVGWLGVGIVVGAIAGPNGIALSAVHELAWQTPGLGLALAVAWVLACAPPARLLVRQEAARYLRSLPGPRRTAAAATIGGLVVVQWPWLVLCFAGGMRAHAAIEAAAIATSTIAIAAIPMPRPSGTPRWRTRFGALLAIYARGLRRRAGDALVRGASFAILAGLIAGLFVRNNQADGAGAGSLAAGVIAVVLAPGWAGALLPLYDTHRASSWLATSLGASEPQRRAVLAIAVIQIYVAAATLAAVVACVFVGDSASAPWMIAVAIATSLGAGLLVTRALIGADRAGDNAAPRAIRGLVTASACAVLALGIFGAAGALAVCALGALAFATAGIA